MRYEYERETSATTKLSYILIGGGIGAILALLFAPKSGEELRGDIADATRKGIDKTKDAAVQLQEKAGEYYEVSREKAGELYSTAQDKAGELYSTAQEKAGELQEKAGELYSNAQEKAADLAGKAKESVGELGEKAKDAAHRTTNPISAALEAGKDAYNDEKRRTETAAIKEGRPTYPVEDKVLELPKERKN